MNCKRDDIVLVLWLHKCSFRNHSTLNTMQIVNCVLLVSWRSCDSEIKQCSYPLVDCGSPCNPRNGSVTSYTGTTNGSVAFYSCNPGLVPVMGMRAVCTGNGWSPNPADLSCTVGMQSVVTGACQGTHV